MRQYTLLLILLLSALNMARGQTAYTYRYWMDNDAAGMNTGTATGEKSFAVNVSQLPAGVHALHLQAYKSDGVLSAVHTQFFAKLTGSKAKSGRYWFDNDASTLKTVATSGTIDIDASGLVSGLHALHYYTVDSDGIPSAVHTQFFAKLMGSTAKSGHYWFDNDANTLTTVAATGTIDIDASSLVSGLHALHFYTVDSNGVPSATHTQFFAKLTEGIGEQGHYWFDNDASTLTTVAATGTIDVDASGLVSGLHALHYYTTDGDGVPSSVHTQFFAKLAGSKAKEGRYWFDNDESTMKTVEATGTIDVDASSLSAGLHALHFYTVDSDGVPSAVHTQFFAKLTENVGIKAQYWFDNDASTLRTVNSVSGTIDLNVSGLIPGLHAIHFQTIAADGTPSSVHTQFIYISEQNGKPTLVLAWIDDDTESARTYALANGNPVIDISGLPDGEHVIHLVLSDAEGAIYGEEARTFFVGLRPGDVNRDGAIDVADIATVISVMAGETGINPALADVNGDGVIDVADIATIIDIMAANSRKR